MKITEKLHLLYKQIKKSKPTGYCGIHRVISAVRFGKDYLGVYQSYIAKENLLYDTYTKLWTEICETMQSLNGDLIKFCERFTKITLELHQNSQSLYLNVRSL